MADRPNVLLICTDHWPGRLMRPAGCTSVMTPTLSQLAYLGRYYPNAYSACPVCVPARQAMMTGLTQRSHGLKSNAGGEMPDVTTLAGAFSAAGYQTTAVGKLHVKPQRDRIGFDEVILNEEGRYPDGHLDDWDLYLHDRGYGGQAYAGGLASNDYLTRPWHLPEDCHPTNWTAAQMCRQIYRRDPRRPAFWYMSFIDPHPPVWPLREYMEQYRDVEMDEPVMGDWAKQREAMPWALRRRFGKYLVDDAPVQEIDLARRAFYATCTHIDHQIRVVLGCLREHGLSRDTIVAFTADHGDMLGDHGLWAKGIYYEPSACVPLIVAPVLGDQRITPGSVDDRLAELRDIMPTLLDLAGVEIPKTVEGRSLIGPERHETLYGASGSGNGASRMIRDERYKLIYYPAGNRAQLFDMVSDRRERHDLAGDPKHAADLERLRALLVQELDEADQAWVKDGRLVGLPEPPLDPAHRDGGDRELHGQRGIRFF